MTMSFSSTDPIYAPIEEMLPTTLRGKLNTRLLPENGGKRTFKKAIIGLNDVYAEVRMFERRVIDQHMQQFIVPVNSRSPIVMLDELKSVRAGVIYRKVYYPNGVAKVVWDRQKILSA
jgi:hypothetical protein